MAKSVKQLEPWEKIKFRPVGTNVAILPDDSNTTAGGIVLPENRERTMFKGRVIAKGKDCKLDFAPGELVTFARYSGTELEIDMTKILVMDEKAILGSI